MLCLTVDILTVVYGLTEATAVAAIASAMDTTWIPAGGSLLKDTQCKVRHTGPCRGFSPQGHPVQGKTHKSLPGVPCSRTLSVGYDIQIPCRWGGGSS